MIEGLEHILEGNGELGLPELRGALRELLDGPAATGHVLDQHRLKSGVYRLRFEVNGRVCSLVVKAMAPEIAQRNWLVMKKWLPAVDLSESAPLLLDSVAERRGQCVWHIYEDLGDWALDASEPDRERVRAVVELVARIHARFAGHPLLPECRLHGGDLGIYFYTSNVGDAIRCLDALRAPAITLSAERLALRDRLLERLYKLLNERPYRAQALAELGGPATFLHGDLWTTNTFVLPTAHGLEARLVDWDRAGVGPVSYDLSMFLLRFPAHHRSWILELYRKAVEPLGWRLPSQQDLNLVFETAECARFANCAIWPALALLRDGSDWAFNQLAAIQQCFETLEPVLPGVEKATA